MTYEIFFTPAARVDIIDALEWSIDHFGEAIQEAYGALIDAAIDDISEDPFLLGSHERSDLWRGLRSIHLRTCRNKVPGNVRAIQAPVHVVFYWQGSDGIHISRVLHEVRNLAEIRFS